MKHKAKTARVRAANATKTARKPRPKKGEAAPAKTPLGTAFVIPGAYVTAAVFSMTDRDREVMGWVRDAMAKAGKEKGSADVTDVLALTGDVSGLFVVARYTAETKKGLVAARLAIRNAAKATFRDAGYSVFRALPR